MNNIILISVDSLRTDFMEIAKRQGKSLPNFERLFKTSCYFSNAVTQGTSSIQSHSSVLSGLGPWTIGTGVHLHFPKPNYSIFYHLTKLGYKTISWHRGVVYLEDRLDAKAVWNNQVGNNTCADEFIDEICTFIKKPCSVPYCIFLHFRYVHWPYGNCEGWTWGDPRYQEAVSKVLEFERTGNIKEVECLYTKCLVRMDKKLGELLNSLKGGELIILFGDHGDSFGEELSDPSNFNITDAHVNAPWESVCKVPLFISLPQRKELIIDNKVRLLDIVPTLWSVLELPKLFIFEGYPLLNSVGEVIALSYNSETWGDFYCSKDSSETGIAWGKDYRIIKNGKVKFVMELWEGTYQLFNLEKNETEDISEEFPEVARWLASFVHFPEWEGLNMYEQAHLGRLERLIKNQYKIIKELDELVHKKEYCGK